MRVEAAWFTLVNVLAVAQTLAISLLLADLVLPELGIVTYRKALAHAVGIAVPAVTSYFGHRYWTFAPKGANCTCTVCSRRPTGPGPRSSRPADPAHLEPSQDAK